MAINRIFYIFILTYYPKISIVQTTNQVPVFTNITVPIQVREDATTETLLDSFNVIDPDGSDVTSCTHTGDSGEFEIRQNIADNTLFELYVLTGAGIEYDTSPSFTLSVSCTDAQSEIGTTNILIDVIPNQPPSITPASSPLSVNENIDVQTQLYTPNVSDVENDPFVCDVKYSNPTSSIFDMWWNSTALEYQLYLKSNPGLSFSTTPTYTVTLECWDDFGSSTSDIVVFITPNSAPTFTNLPGNLSLDASSTSMGTTVFTVTATDADSASLTFSMTSFPATPDLFSIDAVSGEISVVKDLTYAVDGAYLLTVTVSDSKSTTCADLKILLSNTNTVPIIENLPFNVYKDEDMGTNSVIFTMKTSDPDPSDSVTLTFTVWPAAYTSKFYIHQGKHLRLQSNEYFDYEEVNYFRIEFMATDGKAINGPYTLTLYINDVPEKCSFDVSTYYVTMFEGNAGSVTVDPGFIITDEDLGDTYTFSIDYPATSDSSYFSIDGTSGIITFATAYDVDTSHSTNVTLIAVCTDSAGLTGTATVSVTIEDVNDNVPQFTNTGYISYIDQSDSPTTTVRLMNMLCKDKDSDLNAEISYTWTQITAGSGSFFHMNSNGRVLLMTYPAISMTYGDIFTFTITATDHGTPPLSSTTTLDIIYKETNNTVSVTTIAVTTTTTTTTTTETTPTTTSFWDEPVNIMVVVLSAVIGILLAALALYLCTKKFKTFKKWKNGRAKVTKRKVQPKPDQDKTTFDFWNQNQMEP